MDKWAHKKTCRRLRLKNFFWSRTLGICRVSDHSSNNLFGQKKFEQLAPRVPQSNSLGRGVRGCGSFSRGPMHDIMFRGLLFVCQKAMGAVHGLDSCASTPILVDESQCSATNIRDAERRSNSVLQERDGGTGFLVYLVHNLPGTRYLYMQFYCTLSTVNGAQPHGQCLRIPYFLPSPPFGPTFGPIIFQLFCRQLPLLLLLLLPAVLRF
jgi:hypothetical protein